MKLLGISGTIVGMKTSILVNEVLEEIKLLDDSIEVELLDLREFDMQFADGRPFEKYNEDTQKIIRKLESADFFLFGSPVFNGSIPAPLKNIFDLMPPSSFRNKVMGFVANGGTYQHYLMIENQLKPIAGYLRAYTAPNYVYAHNSHFDQDNRIIDDEVQSRIKLLAEELVFMQNNMNSRMDARSGKQPAVKVG
ncbi:NADH-dependent FMN reductase [Bacillus sp. OxB-1]|uniref:NADPH-dependent FMN reductase n=1 Tax=Bacillus sp. (strain OxB-1) TaxID=98228 RepID=UPI000581E759|nr:NADPH-dependent FMN reductase [Bacillus sp. OxB-1]BAQ08587.1 NADH-dependent FMN reductase [Bacillus sp. OxB-1]